MVRLPPAVLRRAWPLGVALACAACASPTLPLPPPSTDPTQSIVDADHITLTAGCASVPANVEVDVANTGHPGGAAIPDTETGVIVTSTSCGSYTAQSVYAHPLDRLEVTYKVGLDVSLPQYVTVGAP